MLGFKNGRSQRLKGKRTCSDESPFWMLGTTKERIDTTGTSADVEARNGAGRVVPVAEGGRGAGEQVLHPEEVQEAIWDLNV